VKPFFSPNLERKGRIARALGGVALLVGGVIVWPSALWAAIPLLACGVFVLFEAFRGWCLLRACGVKTKL
jgi:hypothetical protein